MKANKLFWALFLGLAVAACAPKAEEPVDEDAATSEEMPAEKTAKDFKCSNQEIADVSYLIGINFGSFIKNYDFAKDLSELNLAQLKKGMEDFIKAEGNPRSAGFEEQFRINPNEMNEIFNEYLEKRHSAAVYENKAKQEKFLAANAKKAGVQTTASGLQYKINNPGNEVRATLADTVYVNYKGQLLDGTVFDETPEGADPIKMQLNYVIEGWREGLQLIGEGGDITLYIPYELAYGEQGNPSIAPCSTLIFNVSLAKVGKKVEVVAPEE
ncbi:MAG: FKBP-type peptidyl-prolyl cis-trans isomerase [Bacteroidales bacterium]|nr:FKBP-type peptidyl-prolyl cis-trans isomerase [Candidatus Cryptobacteroides aphodequi]